jgi:hypothetical protein
MGVWLTRNEEKPVGRVSVPAAFGGPGVPACADTRGRVSDINVPK